MLMAKKNQLKNANFLWTSFSSVSSNWSAPKEETHGLIPPVPRAIRAKAQLRKALWPLDAGLHGCFVHRDGCRLCMEAESVNNTIPCHREKPWVFRNTIMSLVQYCETAEWALRKILDYQTLINVKLIIQSVYGITNICKFTQTLLYSTYKQNKY